MRPSVLTKMIGYVKNFKSKDRDNDYNNKLTYFLINDKKLFE